LLVQQPAGIRQLKSDITTTNIHINVTSQQSVLVRIMAGPVVISIGPAATGIRRSPEAVTVDG